MHNKEIQLRPVGELKTNPSNARTHSDRQVEQIANSIMAFGFVNPVLLDASDSIIAGHGRVRAAKLLGLDEIPTLRVEHLSDAQIRGYVIADNRLAELAGWDRDVLRIELQNLFEMDIDFEVTDVGFATAEIDLLLSESGDETDPADETVPDIPDRSVSSPGDIWQIGPHRLLCGNALEWSSYEGLLDGELARATFTDPPYNLRVSEISGLGAAQHREFVMASGEMSEAEFTRFLSLACRNMAAASVDGAVHFICMDWRHLSEVLRAGRIAFDELLNLCVWSKSAGGMGSLYRSAHELVLVYKSGTSPHVNNVQLGRFGRNRTNIWTFSGLNSFQRDRQATLALHPTIKPVGLVADAILDVSRRNDIILDPFVGSGTSIIAAHRTGRRCFAMELDPRYTDVALRRVSQVIGIEPICARSGRTFSEVELGPDHDAYPAHEEV